jgi:hypothetical protein
MGNDRVQAIACAGALGSTLSRELWPRTPPSPRQAVRKFEAVCVLQDGDG